MSLESAGQIFNVDKLKSKLKERYPNYNFDVAPEPDTKCKAPHVCLNNKIFYTDMEGNTYCGARYKQTEEDNYHKWTYQVCHAMVKKADQGGNQDVIPF